MEITSNNKRAFYTKGIFILLAVHAVIFSLIYFSSLLQPFAVAIIVWYLIRTLRDQIGKLKIKKKSMPRWLLNLLSILVAALIIEVCVELIALNINNIVDDYTIYEQKLIGLVNELKAIPGSENLIKRIKTGISEMRLQGYLNSLLSSLSSGLGNIVIIVIYTVFLMLEETSFAKKFHQLFTNESTHRKAVNVSEQIFSATNKYVTLKTVVSLLTGVLSYIVLVIIGVDYAFLWAFMIFLFNYIPYIGSMIATLLPALFAILQFGSFWPALWVLVSVEAVQIFVGNYVEPKVMGKSLNLSPLVVLLSLTIWGYIWGLLGMILSVPITSIMIITMAQFDSTRKIAILLSETGNVDDLIVKDGASHKK